MTNPNLNETEQNNKDMHETLEREEQQKAIKKNPRKRPWEEYRWDLWCRCESLLDEPSSSLPLISSSFPALSLSLSKVKNDLVRWREGEKYTCGVMVG